VCESASDLGREVLDGLGSLVEKSLLRPVPGSEAEPRFAMLATIREYALEHLEAAGEGTDLRRRHAEAYLALVEGCAAELTGPMGRRWLDRLELDHDNLRAALDWAVATDHAEVALRLVAASWRFWQIRGHLFEAEDRMRQVLALPGATSQSPLLRARALGAAGSIAYWRGDPPEAHRRYRDALDEARRSGDKAVTAEALYNFAFSSTEASPNSALYELGKPHLAEALSLYRELGDQRGIANTNWALGVDAVARREWVGARSYIEASLGVYDELDDPFGTGWALHELALIDANEGEFDAAELRAREALRIFNAAGDLSAAVLLLLDMVFIARGQGDLDRGWRLAGAADTIRHRSGTDLVGVVPWQDWEVPMRPTEDPHALELWDEGAALSPEAAIAYALAESPA